MFVPRRLAWMVLILLFASFLRLHDLPHVPPGMTHDEADHGLDAWRVVQGERPIYFTVGYGREPLYDYSTALLMSFLGPAFLVGRLTSVFFSLILIAGTYAWLRQAFDARVALLTAAGLALAFWPLMTARQALRSETLPALLVLAVAVYWRGLENWRMETGDWRMESKQSPVSSLQSLIPNLKSPFLYSALLLGLTFYTYIPSRVLWLLFPALLVYLWLLGEPAPWRGTLLALGVAALVGLPLFIFLLANPGAEARVGQLAQPLQQAARGEFGPLWANVRSGLGIFTVAGDPQWRYNAAGRPLLPPLPGVLFYGGVAYAAWRALSCVWLRRSAGAQKPGACRRAPALFLALLWLALGLSPALATGRELSTTQAIGMQPVLYLFPALVLAGAAQRLEPWLARRSLAPGLILPAAALLLGALLLANTWRAYFQTWAQDERVAIQYEAELVSIVRRLNETAGAAAAPVAISTDAPGRFHDPATARLFLKGGLPALRWFDGRHSLLLPARENALIVFSAAAPLHPALAPYLQALEPAPASLGAGPGAAPVAVQLTHSPSRLLQLYPQFSTEINTLSTELSTDLVFGDVIQLLAHDLPTGQVAPGATLQLVTLWQVRQPPSEDLVIFTHLLGADGAPLAQADRLDAPVHSWQSGDLLIQLHELPLPADLPAGEYALAVGLYHAADWRQRLPLRVDGAQQGDVLPLTTLVVQP